jgi:TPP-dependent pyruvate/acetoin dehydrogenase alpha subunit
MLPLTLTSIDGMRHLVVGSEGIVAAIAFAARAGHSNRTAYRFVTVLVMQDALTSPARWGDLLRMVMDLESKDA